MIILISMILAIGVVSYFVCGIPFGLLIARIISDIDIRRAGSGNVGTANVARVLGKGAGVLTLLLDAGKAALCCWGGLSILAEGMANGNVATLCPGGASDWVSAFLLLVAIVGHVFSPYLGFRGGKGIAVGFGALFVLSWKISLILLAIFIIVFLALRRVSIGSICAAMALPIVSCIFCGATMIFTIGACITTGIIIWAHRSNIKKLFHGEEHYFTFGCVHKTAEPSGQAQAPENECYDVSSTTSDTDRHS